ncbi:hypothetical protein C2E20_3294 [Micractinium conductrix]|uniref:Uncharacterized protein n=1 Tax=Micractinium conductrix TaxID=554055 RepID=A0A2P6VGY5_9CHLO|nr:hypothetical protein C2E20_3294 [Micractinium conductrix]|eukprot:PSC73351.1 hypothetical protein C2E20_3294 [Micractinium conductrix]
MGRQPAMRAATAAAVCLLALLCGGPLPATAQGLLLSEVRSALTAVANAASAATAAATGSLLGSADAAGLSGALEAAAARRADRLASLTHTAHSTAAMVEAAREARRAALTAGLSSLEAQQAGVGSAMRSLVDGHVSRLRGLGAGLLEGGASWRLGEHLSDHVPPAMGALGDAGMTMHLPLRGGLAAWRDKAVAFDECVSQLHASLSPSRGLSLLTPEERRALVEAWDDGLFECRNGLNLH